MHATTPIRVLNVDDFAPQLYAKSRVLRHAGFEVFEAATGEQALKLLSEAQPHVVLLDVNLPDISGIEVCHRIKSDPQTASVLVVQTSATYTSQRQQDFAMSGGADLFLVEPLEAEELISAVRALLRLRGAEAGMRESEARFRALADTAPVLIWMSGTDMLCDYFNRAWLDLTGRSLEEEFGNRWTEGMHPDDLERWLKTYSAAFHARQQFEAEYRLMRHDGEYRWILSRGVPRFALDGTFQGYVGSGVDVTDKKRFDEEREALLAAEHAAREIAEAANRLKDDFLATVSHELRTPLNAMLGWANLLGTGKLSADSSAKAIDVIMRNARAQAQLIDEILDASRIVSGKMLMDFRRVDLPGVVAAAVDSIRPAAEAKGVALQTIVDPELAPVEGDAGRLQQVTLNLLSNAIKFTPAGGKVEVKLVAHGASVDLRVSDSGEGIKPDFLPHIFERFRQADASTTRRHGGLGLGLAIVRYIVEQHGGHVSAESEGKNQGATFTVSLPIAKLRPSLVPPLNTPVLEPIDTDAESERPSVLEGAVVLLVDDEPSALELLATVFRQAGAVALTANSAEAALEVMTHGAPKLIVSDIGMPGADGYSFIEQVRALEKDGRRQTPAIALTAYARLEDKLRAFHAGYQAHIGKPIVPRQLIAIAASVVEAAENLPQ